MQISTMMIMTSDSCPQNNISNAHAILHYVSCVILVYLKAWYAIFIPFMLMVPIYTTELYILTPIWFDIKLSWIKFVIMYLKQFLIEEKKQIKHRGYVRSPVIHHVVGNPRNLLCPSKHTVKAGTRTTQYNTMIFSSSGCI